MISSKEMALLKAKEQFQQLLDRVERPLDKGERIDTVERELFAQLLNMGYQLLILFVANQGDGDVGETVPVGAKVWRRLPEPHTRRYVSIFGELAIARYVYGTREGQKIEHMPLDARLGLPAGDFSYVYEDWSQRLCVKEAFAEANQSLWELLGLSTGVRTLENMNQTMAPFASAFQEEQGPPPAAEEGAIAVFTADAKGVPMRRPLEERLRGQRRGKGEKSTEKQMAYVGATYTIDPFVRTADDLLEEIDRKAYAAARPKPCHKRIWTEITEEKADAPCPEDKTTEAEVAARPADPRLAAAAAAAELKKSANGRDRLFGRLAEEVQGRSQAGKDIVCLFDGDANLWNLYLLCFAGLGAVGILDLMHVIEWLWKAAHCFHAEGSDEAYDFTRKYLRMLLEGKVGYVIGAFRQMLTKKTVPRNKRKTLWSVITYFENHRQYMKYDEYLAKGYPVGTGVVEGACRYVVKDRMERSGMRWSQAGAQAVLDLRAIFANDQWNEFVHYRIAQEQQLLYSQAA